MGALYLKAMIRSRDLDRSRRFYEGDLGFEVVEEWDSPGDRGFIVRVGGQGGYLELLASDEETLINDKIELQIHVESVNGWAARLSEVGETQGPVSRPWGNTYLWIRDPDGVRIAFFEGPLPKVDAASDPPDAR